MVRHIVLQYILTGGIFIRYKFIAVSVVLSMAVAVPMTSSAVIADFGGISEKSQSYSGFSLSVPDFRLSDNSGINEIVPCLSFADITENVNPYSKSSNLPSKYDMRDYGGISSVKNQGSEGTCWAHSAIASAETSMIRSNPNIDLSEYHTSYYTYYGDDQIKNNSSKPEDIINSGGNLMSVANLWSQWIGPVSEKKLPYGNLDFFNDNNAVADMQYESSYHMKNAFMFDFNSERSNADEVNNLVKQFVYSGIAVDVSFHSDIAKYYSSEYNSARSTRKPRFANHSVAIAGWDDDFPAENFAVPAENNGAWLVKNSWGDNRFRDGYMWISYEDLSLCEFGAFELEDSDEYVRNFHHDTFAPIQSMSAYDSAEEKGASYMANVFYSDTEMQIDAVSTYITAPDTEYEITVYSGLSDSGNPVSGTPSAVTKGIAPNTGIVELELEKSAVIGAEENFSVVVKLYCADYPYVIPIESVMWIQDSESGDVYSLGHYCDYEQIKSNTQTGESFYSPDGENWNDTSDEEYTYNEDEKAYLLEQLENDLYDGIYPEETELLENAASSLAMYKTLFSMGNLNISMGNISLKALGRPVNSIDFSHASGIVHNDEKISLSVKNNEDVYYSVNGGEYQLYIEPVAIEKLSYVSATADFLNYTERCYLPENIVPETGDVDADGKIDSTDASFVLSHYAGMSTGGNAVIGKPLLDYADVDGNGFIDASDASTILIIYAENSTR